MWLRTNTYSLLIFLILQLGACWVDQEIYHSDQELEREINKIIKESNGRFVKRNCSNDDNIHIIESQSQTSTNMTKEKQLFGVLVCNEHAREVFSAEVCLTVIKKLLKHPSALTSYKKLKIIYNANPISRQKALSGDYCLRTNENGVDLNRNFIYRFAQNSKEGSSEYPGQRPLSETYSQCLNEQTNIDQNQSQVIKAFMSIHTGQFSIYTTNCNTHQTNLKEMGILYNIRDKVCPYCKFRQALTNGHGNSYEDMKCRKGFKYSNVFEVYGGYNAHLSQQQNCWVIFNPTSKSFYNLYLERAANMIVSYFEQISQEQMAD